MGVASVCTLRLPVKLVFYCGPIDEYDNIRNRDDTEHNLYGLSHDLVVSGEPSKNYISNEAEASETSPQYAREYIDVCTKSTVH